MSADLSRFVDAQESVWDDVRRELRSGRKQTHWMWFVFPQLAELGRSSTAKHYGLAGADEAKAYLDHPVLGARLKECCELLLAQEVGDPVAVFGSIDAMKLRSCLTLFAAVAPEVAVFDACLRRFFAGERDPLTSQLLQA